MITQKMVDAFNYQINRELYSAYLYLSMSAYCSDIGLSGFANWFSVQVQEESFHARRMFDYLLERGGKIELDAIEKPEGAWNNLLEVYEQTLSHEEYVTSLINKLADVAEEEKDRAAMSFLQWFIDEQVEEENNARDIISKLKLIGESGNALYALDKEFSARVFVQPTV